MFCNAQLIRYVGEDGIAAFIGHSVGTAPVIGFHLGAHRSEELKSILRKSFVLIGITSVAMLALSQALALPLEGIWYSIVAARYRY